MQVCNLQTRDVMQLNLALAPRSYPAPSWHRVAVTQSSPWTMLLSTYSNIPIRFSRSPLYPPLFPIVDILGRKSPAYRTIL